MSKEFNNEIDKPENWDFGRPEVRKPVKASRVVVSVAFRRGDFDLVAKYAALLGKKTSEFIRDAAIEKARKQDSATLVYGSGSLGTIWSTEQMPTITIVSGIQTEHPEETGAITY